MPLTLNHPALATVLVADTHAVAEHGATRNQKSGVKIHLVHYVEQMWDKLLSNE